VSIFRTKLLPFESCILNAVAAALGAEWKTLYASQLACINKVQRLLKWNEIEFYCMRLFKVRWPESVLFENRGEFALASGVLQANALQATVSVFAVNGHVFSLESCSSLKAFRACKQLQFTVSSVAA
jgi:hypothetical protein